MNQLFKKSSIVEGIDDEIILNKRAETNKSKVKINLDSRQSIKSFGMDDVKSPISPFKVKQLKVKKDRASIKKNSFISFGGDEGYTP